jgi:hypothetical protein
MVWRRKLKTWSMLCCRHNVTAPFNSRCFTPSQT